MYRNAIVRKILFIISSAVFLVPVAVSAATPPIVNSFSASAASLQNNYPFALSWNLSNDAGADVVFSCPFGVTVFSNGSAVPCGTATALSSVDSGSTIFTLLNVSGFTQNVTATLYPKDTTGVDYTSGAPSVNLSIATSPNPILSFSVSTSTVSSGGPVTLSWTGVDTTATNIIFDCAVGVQLFLQGSTAPLPCGTQAFSSDQSQSGSVTVTATNSSLQPMEVSARILPAIASGTYDATHGKAVSFSVAGMVTAPNPAGISLTASSTQVVSGTPFALNWATQNAANANLEFTCGNGLSITAVTQGATTTVPCNGLGFTPALSANSSTMLSVQNMTGQVQTVSATLLPGDANGNYFAIGAKTLSLSVFPPGTSLSADVTTNSVSSVNTGTSNITGPSVAASTSNSSPVTHAPFTLALSRGMQNAQVSALQTFLAQNSSIYPEASVTGYFGALTLAAIERFQVKYKIANPGDEGYGLVGPKTRAQLNTLQTP